MTTVPPPFSFPHSLAKRTNLVAPFLAQCNHHPFRCCHPLSRGAGVRRRS
jgi:hypothetical protein